jgi:hypothetical protein
MVRLGLALHTNQKSTECRGIKLKAAILRVVRVRDAIDLSSGMFGAVSKGQFTILQEAPLTVGPSLAPTVSSNWFLARF